MQKLNVSSLQIRKRWENFNNIFYVHFFVSTKKRTKENDPKRCFRPLRKIARNNPKVVFRYHGKNVNAFWLFLRNFPFTPAPARRFGRPTPHSVSQRVCLLIFSDLPDIFHPLFPPPAVDYWGGKTK